MSIASTAITLTADELDAVSRSMLVHEPHSDVRPAFDWVGRGHLPPCLAYRGDRVVEFGYEVAVVVAARRGGGDVDAIRRAIESLGPCHRQGRIHFWPRVIPAVAD
ncbi:Uncharacterised protein [Mycobacteroides abscessus subsp. bolletii]|uniref:hypothetical protein n=1 Tax=Mycobacteroides abscessus TaxID=36809 RepID=UPI0009A8F3EE|nr:hypothetical protein [Mycobacteroides abscessus]WJJ56189.1 hypothetical protein PROPHIT371_107 [Mycobacterium phage prophiT37-1]SKY25462.1 Uncharacterised protein [Mycobacteroides abscessus subsp. bolletii]